MSKKIRQITMLILLGLNILVYSILIWSCISFCGSSIEGFKFDTSTEIEKK